VRRLILIALCLIACQFADLRSGEAAKLISCPGVASGASCGVNVVSLSGVTPTTVLTLGTGAMTEIADPSAHGKSEYVYSYTGTLDSTLEYRAWCYCTKGSDTWYWMYVWEPFETRIDAAVTSRSTYAGGAVASVTGSVGSVTSPVTVGTNNDKTGYAVNSVTDKSGYSLSVSYNAAMTAASQASVDALPTGTTINAIKAKTDLLPASPASEDTLLRGLGLNQENQVEDDFTYDGQNMKMSSIMYLYDSRTHAQMHDKVTGLVAKYSVSYTRDVNHLVTKITATRDL